MTNEAMEKCIEIVGTQKLLAEKVGCDQSVISRALNSKLKAELVLPVEKAVKGKVTRHELRPDLYPKEKSTSKK